MGLETLLADEPGAMDQFEEMFLAYAMGLIEGRTGTGPPREGRLMEHFGRIVTDPRLRLAGIGSPSPLHISNQAYAVLLAGQAGATRG
jgi:hypothetical protein